MGVPAQSQHGQSPCQKFTYGNNPFQVWLRATAQPLKYVSLYKECEDCKEFVYDFCVKCLKPKFTPEPLRKLVCCGKKMQIEDDTSAQCYECGKNIRNAVPNATREQYYANGGRKKTPYKRIKYFREWMNHIQGLRPVYLVNETMELIALDLEEPTPQSLRKTLKRLKLGKYYKAIPYLLSEITGKSIPEVSDMTKAEWMFCRLDKDIPYYPDVIYEIFYKIDPNHPLLGWIPSRQ